LTARLWQNAPVRKEDTLTSPFLMVYWGRLRESYARGNSVIASWSSYRPCCLRPAKSCRLWLALNNYFEASGIKLSNSGEILKLLVPNYIRKNICGWSNDSSKVISQKMRENKMDNRGSKSSIWINLGVKEQRVDGSCLPQVG